MGEQLGLVGIGQKKCTLGMWKKENEIFTHHAAHMDSPKWTCWDELEDPEDFLSNFGPDYMGYGDSEKEAILDFCEKCKVEIPFWWK